MSAADVLTDEATRGADHAVTALHQHALDVVRSVMAPALLEEARQLLRAAGIGQARAKVTELRVAVLAAPDMVANTRTALLAAQDRERLVREQYEVALAEAEWTLDGKFVSESNKTFLVVWHTADSTGKAEAEAKGWTFVPDAADGEGVWQERRAMTADERAAWKKRTAATAREVAPLASDVRSAEHAVALARVDVDTAENRWQATRAALTAAIADVEAACAEVACLARSLGGQA